MKQRNSSRTARRNLLASTAAVVLALASSAALAGAMAGPDEEDPEAPGKAEACRAIGCPNGNRLCGTTSGKLISGGVPFIGEVAVGWTCYEPTPAS